MMYYDIHTHNETADSQVVSVVNCMPAPTVDGVEEMWLFPAGEHLFSVGIHPWTTREAAPLLEQLACWLANPRVIAVGEAGVDKAILTPLPQQLALFEAQARLAEQVGKPLIIHCVRAWTEILEVRRQVSPRMPWLIHGFRGKGMLARQLIGHGFYLSFGTKFNPEAVREAWPSRLLAETDDTKESIRTVYQRLAEVLSVGEPELMEQLAQNVRALGLLNPATD